MTEKHLSDWKNIRQFVLTLLLAAPNAILILSYPAQASVQPLECLRLFARDPLSSFQNQTITPSWQLRYIQHEDTRVRALLRSLTDSDVKIENLDAVLDAATTHPDLLVSEQRPDPHHLARVALNVKHRLLLFQQAVEILAPRGESKPEELLALSARLFSDFDPRENWLDLERSLPDAQTLVVSVRNRDLELAQLLKRKSAASPEGGVAKQLEGKVAPKPLNKTDHLSVEAIAKTTLERISAIEAQLKSPEALDLNLDALALTWGQLAELLSRPNAAFNRAALSAVPFEKLVDLTEIAFNQAVNIHGKKVSENQGIIDLGYVFSRLSFTFEGVYEGLPARTQRIFDTLMSEFLDPS